MPLNTLRDLQESRGKNVTDMNAACSKVAGDSHDLSSDQRKRFDALGTQVRSFSNRLADAQKLTDFERQVACDEVRRMLFPTKTIVGGVIRTLTTDGTSDKLVASNLTAMTSHCRATLKVNTTGTSNLRKVSKRAAIWNCRAYLAPLNLTDLALRGDSDDA